MTRRTRMSAETFAATVDRGRFRDSPSLAGARLMLVDGLTAREASARLNVSLQTIARCARDIRKLAIQHGICPLCGGQAEARQG